MGTNFYCAGPGDEHLHIGKSSMGWKFGFHGIPEMGLTSWSAWKSFLSRNVIFDEYMTRISYDELIERVEKKQAGVCKVDPRPEDYELWGGYDRYLEGRRYAPTYHDAEGYDFGDYEFF